MFSHTYIQEIAIQTNLPESEVEDILKTFWDIFRESLLDGDFVEIPGLGTFKVQHMNSLKEIDQETGHTILNPPKDFIEFTPES